jgi:hypothetical protein
VSDNDGKKETITDVLQRNGLCEKEVKRSEVKKMKSRRRRVIWAIMKVLRTGSFIST